MKKYLVIGCNVKPLLPQDLTSDQQQAWLDYFKTLGDRIVDGGNPLVPQRAVIKDGEVGTLTDTPVGYYMMSAESLEEACELVKGSPFSNAPGCEVRIYETMPM